MVHAFSILHVMPPLVLLIALSACRPDTPALLDSDSGIADSGGVTVDTADTGDGAAVDSADPDTAAPDPGDGLHGSAPDPAIPLPAFTATNRDGTPRGPENLIGNPTIIWFYRDAGSAG